MPHDTMKLVLLTTAFCALCPFVSPGQAVVLSQTQTIVVVRFTNERFLVAADSRESGGASDPRNSDVACKIVPLGTKMFAVFTGVATIPDPGTHSFLVNAPADFKKAFEKFKNEPNTAVTIKHVAERWAQIMTVEFDATFKQHPDALTGLIQRDHVGDAVFAGTTSDGTLAAYAVYIQAYFSPEGAMPDIRLRPHVKPVILPWKYDPDLNHSGIWVAGSDDKLGVAEFFGKTSPRAVAARNALRNAINSTLNPDAEALSLTFAIKSALTWAVHQNQVGGDVDVLELRKGSDINWIQAKDSCKTK